MKILFLEDDKAANEMASEYLRRGGHSVQSVFTVQEAWSDLIEQDFQYDLVIADRKLPDGDGADFAVELQDRHPEIQIAIVSAFLSQSDKDNLRQMGIRCYSKPVLYSKVVNDANRPPPNDRIYHDPRAMRSDWSRPPNRPSS